MLQNLYLLHDTSFDEELRRAAIYITDRRVIFQMIEAAHYQLRKDTPATDTEKTTPDNEHRTLDLIDTFLDAIPVEDDKIDKHRKPTPADAAIDYVAYLLETESDSMSEDTPQLKGHDLIDNFLQQEQGRIMLDLPQEEHEDSLPDNSDDNDEEYFTETLARIYIKQGRYQKALDIITRLSGKYPQKNAYFADQIRFLEKLIINNKKK
jgi:predicted Zn-dependent protease